MEEMMKPVHNPIKTRRAKATGYGCDYGEPLRQDLIDGGDFYDYGPGDLGIIEGIIEKKDALTWRIRASNGRLYSFASTEKWEEIDETCTE
jgi:hypothetical protein